MNGQSIETSIIDYLASLPFPRDDAHAWGYQLRALNTPLYAAKFLIFTNSLPGSWHHHEFEKDETFICLDGRVKVELRGADDTVLSPGDVLRIGYHVHRASALEYPAVILEVSTHDDDSFTHRVNDLEAVR